MEGHNIYGEILAFKATSFSAWGSGPLCAKAKHLLYISSTYCMTNKYSYNLFSKKTKLSRNMHLRHVLVKKFFLENL